jgi:hypothetical protein
MVQLSGFLSSQPDRADLALRPVAPGGRSRCRGPMPRRSGRSISLLHLVQLAYGQVYHFMIA